MELFNNITRERFTAIVENYINDILDDKGTSNVEDLASAFSNAGFTKSEFFQILDKYYLNDFNWTEETAPVPNVEDVNVGDNDQAILETALAQIGIPYTWGENPEGGCIFVEEVEDGKTTGKTVAEIYFTKEGEFNGLC